MGEGETKDDSSSEGDRKSEKFVTELSQPPPPPPPQGYPFPPPYQAHPPYPVYPKSDYHYGPVKPTPPGYYPTTAQNFVLIGPPHRSPGYKFARVFLVVLIMIFFGVTVLSLLAWLIYGSDIPVFYAQSLNMTVFRLDNTGINATLSANMSVRNPSERYEVQYEYVEAALVYEDNLLDTNYVNPFVLAKTERGSISFKFQIPNAHQKNIAGAAWEKDIESDRRDKGAVVFDMRIIANAVYRRNDHPTTSRTLRIFCGELEIVFPSPTDTTGKLNDKYKDCIILSN